MTALVWLRTTPLLPAAGPPILLTLLVVFCLYLVWEVAVWCGGNRARLTRGQLARRLTGGALIAAELLLWLLFDPLMLGQPARAQLIYLLGAVALLPLVVILAVRESVFVARQYARWRAELVREMVRPDLDRRSDG